MKSITFKTKISELLEEYPQLEDTLLQLSPAFAKLKNPILRRTIAKVTSVRQAAEIAGLDAEDVVTMLRKQAGIYGNSKELEDEGDASISLEKFSSVPEWFSPGCVITTYDASKTLESGDVPMGHILQETKKLLPKEVFEFTTPFVPAPILDMLTNKGFIVWCRKSDTTSLYHNFVTPL